MSFEKDNKKGMIKIMKAYKGFEYDKSKNTLYQFIDFIQVYLEDPETDNILEFSLNFSSESVEYINRYDDEIHTCDIKDYKYFINSLFKESQQTKKSLKGK